MKEYIHGIITFLGILAIVPVVYFTLRTICGLWGFMLDDIRDKLKRR